MAFTERIGNVPFASLIATLVVFAGVGVFCGTLYKALSIVLRSVMEGLFQFKVPWLEIIQIVFIVVAVIMALFAILLLVFGFLATGATRKNVYSGAKCIMGGRISAAFFMIVSYLLNLAWMVIMSLGVVPIIFYVSIKSICATEVYSKGDLDDKNACFKLTQFGIYRNSSYAFGIKPPGVEEIKGHDCRLFCDHIEEAGPLFCVAYAGAFLICLGMLHFMICLAANYTRIRISSELTEYRDAIDMEELDLNSGGDKSSTQY